MKSFKEFLNERSAHISKTELKVGEVYDDCIYIGEFKDYNYYVVPKELERRLIW